MSRFKSRIATVAVGIFLCLIVLEVSLRAVGFVYSRLSESDKGKGGSDRTTVLCVGDSVTFGIGATKEFSYPAQLQNLLDQSTTGSNEKYNVINRGWPGQNTARLLTRLEKYLQEFKPDIVTILIGAQNQANFFGYRQYIRESHNKKSNFWRSLHDSLDTIRIYKLFRLLIRDIENVQIVNGDRKYLQKADLSTVDSIPGELTQEFVLYTKRNNSIRKTVQCQAALDHKIKGNYDKALSLIIEAAENREVEAECHYIAGTIYRERQQYEKAREWFAKGVQQDPTLFGNYEGIGDSYRYQGKMTEAIPWFKKGFEQARSRTLHKLCYVGINVAFEDSGDIEGAIDFFTQEMKRRSADDQYLRYLARDYLMMFQKNRVDQDVYGWIKRDINQIISLCKAYGAVPVLQNYPFEPLVNSLYKTIARDAGILFVDHQVSFKGHVKNGIRSADYFVADGHPNSAGYRLMAQNIHAALTGNRDRKSDE